MKKNSINILSLTRIPISIIFCLILLHNNYSLSVIFILYFLVVISDFIDGKLARKYHLQSSLGAKIDVLSDFFFMLTSYYTLIVIKVFPMWVIFLIIYKFIEFILTSKFYHNKNVFYYDKLGRGVAVLYYALPIIGVIIHAILPQKCLEVVNLLFILVLLLSLTSTLIRIINVSSINLFRK